MEKFEAYEKIRAKREKREKRNKVILTLLTVLIIGSTAGHFGYQHYLTQKEYQEGIDAGYISPEPILDAIDQKTFEDLPVGLIYEVSEEDQMKYLEAAKAKYEKYGHLGALQEVTTLKVGTYLDKREDATPRRNEKPSDMLNQDFSLRYPDMFYGFVIHDDTKTKLWTDDVYPAMIDELQKYDRVSRAMNIILFMEDYYKNNNKAEKQDSAFDSRYHRIINKCEYLSDHPFYTVVSLALESGFLPTSKEQGIVKTLFTNLAIPTLGYGVYGDQYEIAYNENFNKPGVIDTFDYFHEADNVKGFINKYNVIDEVEETYPVFYFPTKVWKVDNNTIIVDIQIENANNMNMFDTFEILAKLVQSNLTKITEVYEEYEWPEYDKGNTYLVMGRFFNSDLTQGVMPDMGFYPINYFGVGKGWFIGDNGLKGNYYVFNDKAQDFLRDYYSILKETLEADKTPFTRNILKEAAKKNNISYNDAMEIFITHYLMTTMMS